jgi:hypothetical protein
MIKTLFTAFVCLSLFFTALVQQAQRRTGAINGRVVAEDGAPVNGARVSLITVGERNAGSGRNVELDGEGNFTINNLEALSYRVIVSMPGYITVGEEEPWRVAHVGGTVNVTLTKGGVITGRVINQNGEAVIGIVVEATRVEDGAGRPLALPGSSGGGGYFSATDDRGTYRLYGLLAGNYVVSAPSSSVFINNSPYLGTVPTFYPSNTREGATEVQVTPGGEVSDIDIRYRSELGHSISGKVSGAIPGGGDSGLPRGVWVKLTALGTQQLLSRAFVQTRRDQFSFELKGVANGDYEISALATSSGGANALASPRRITVRNTDVSGVELALVASASIGGKVVVEPAVSSGEQVPCIKSRTAILSEIVLDAQPVMPRKAMAIGNSETAVAEDGAFTFFSLEAGQYYLRANLPSDNWYVKSVVSPTEKTTDGGVLTVRTSEKLSGVILTLAEGATQISGKWQGRTDAKMRVHLVPADNALANNVLRYAETFVQPDGTFAFTHLAPGKYWLLAKPVHPSEIKERMRSPLAWSAASRIILRKEAESAAPVVELSPCKRLGDYRLPTQK